YFRSGADTDTGWLDWTRVFVPETPAAHSGENTRLAVSHATPAMMVLPKPFFGRNNIHLNSAFSIQHSAVERLNFIL
ncbi:MAG: hypothetical protein ABW115_13135, partial [Candidatus Thiodiazotropha sp. 6PLUC6]